MSAFERYLTVWVFLSIAGGIVLGQVFPGVFAALGAAEVSRVNLAVAGLIWLMIVPMLLKVDFGALSQLRAHAKGMGVTLFVNWAVKPFSMALLAWVFIRGLFAPLLPAAQIDSYVAGLILLAAAPCTAMVFVWSNLSDGDPTFTLTQVALNDAIMIVAFAPRSVGCVCRWRTRSAPARLNAWCPYSGPRRTQSAPAAVRRRLIARTRRTWPGCGDTWGHSSREPPFCARRIRSRHPGSPPSLSLGTRHRSSAVELSIS